MKRFFFLLPTLLIGITLFAQPQLSLTQFSSGFYEPTEITNAGDSRLFIVQQNGYIYIVDSLGNVNSTPFLYKSVNTNGNEQGLLGLAFDPNYSSNGYFYINYTASNSDTKVSRFQVSSANPDIADPNSEVVLLTVDQPYSNHNGGCLKFGPDGYLYIGLGDGGWAGDPGNRSQDPTELLGKMLRIDVSTVPYTIPVDNPFIADPNTLDEIWAIGLRNPWKYSFDRATGDLWIADVGQDDWEEIDFQPANSVGGENYGWRCYEGDHPYNTSGCSSIGNYTFPVYEYVNSNSMGCSVTGGFVYRGAKYSNMYGYYLFADYCSGKIWATLNNNGNFTTSVLGNFTPYEYTTFGEDQYGELYIAERTTGIIRKVQENNPTPTAVILGPDSLVVCDQPFTTINAVFHPDNDYQWYLNGSIITGADNSSLEVTQTGDYTVEVTTTINDMVFVNISDQVVVGFGTTPQVEIINLPDTICQFDVIDLSTFGSGNPAGGVWFGDGVTSSPGSNSLFDPEDTGLTFPDYCTVTYSYTDSDGCVGTGQHDFYVEMCSGIEDYYIQNFNIYPNPSFKKVTIEASLPNLKDPNAVIIDALGNVIQKIEANFKIGENNINVDISNLSEGVYIIALSSNNYSKFKKLIVYGD